MTGQLARVHFPSVDVPESDRFIVAAGRNDLGVRHPGYSGNSSKVALKGVEVFTSARFPYSDRCVRSYGDQLKNPDSGVRSMTYSS